MTRETRFRADCCCCCGHGVPVELLKKYAKMIPKVELHVHIEGTVGDRLARQIARENELIHHPLLLEDTSSSESSSLHGYTRSCTEVSSGLSENESPKKDLREVKLSPKEKATHTNIEAAQGKALHQGSELVSLIRSTSPHCNLESPSNTSPRAVGEEQRRLHESPVVDELNSTCILSSDQSLHKDSRLVSPPRRSAHRRKEENHERLNRTQGGTRLSQKFNKNTVRRRTSYKHLNTVACEDSPSGHRSQFLAKKGDEPRDILCTRNRKMRIYSNLDAFLLDYMDRALIMRKAENYYKILLAYLESAAADNVRHVEFHFAHDPTTHIPWRTQLQVKLSLRKYYRVLLRGAACDNTV